MCWFIVSMRSDGSFMVNNVMGQSHRLGIAGVPVQMVYRGGKYVMTLPETHLTTEFLGICKAVTVP